MMHTRYFLNDDEPIVIMVDDDGFVRWSTYVVIPYKCVW